MAWDSIRCFTFLNVLFSGVLVTSTTNVNKFNHLVWHNNQCYKKVVLDSFDFDGHTEFNDRPSKLLKSLKCTQLWLDQYNVILFLVKKSH